MPIEIRELVIRATVDPLGASPGGCGAGAPGEAEKRRSSATPADGDLVETCVREVLRILEEKQER